MRPTETKEYLQKVAAQCADVEIYIFADKRCIFHSDFVKCCYLGLDDLPEEIECRWEVMNEEDYEHSLMANSDIFADFADWYGDKNAKVLVIGLYTDPVNE